MGLLLWPNQNFPHWILKKEFTADEPPLRIEGFVPEICEISVPRNSTVTMLAILHLSVVEQRQVITIIRKKSALPSYAVTLRWLVTQHGVGREWNGVNPIHTSASIQGCTQVSLPETEEDSQSNSKFQLFTHLPEKLDSNNSSHSKFPSDISFTAERDFVLFGNTSHSEWALKYWSETIAGGREGRHSKLPEGKLQFSNQITNEGSLTWW